MKKTALVFGGTGPTGPYIVDGLLERGYKVTILHRGTHEIDETPAEVEHLHTDPYDKGCVEKILVDRRFDLCIASYGRLRAIAQVMASKCDRFLSVGGAPAYKGYHNPELCGLSGMDVPILESQELVSKPEQDEKGWRVARTEESVFELIPNATHFRYPYIYGRYQLVPREWLFVRRFMEGRTRIILPDGGLTLHSYGYAENVAHALLLAVDKPEKSIGKIYNVTDLKVLTLKQVCETIAEYMNVNLEIINMPWELAVPSRPMIQQNLTSHRIQDVSALRYDLGYEDKIDPRQALRNTVDWLLAHPPEDGGTEDMVLEDHFDYEAEDRLIDAWQHLLAQMPDYDGVKEPGLGMAYSGPGCRPRSQKTFAQ